MDMVLSFHPGGRKHLFVRPTMKVYREYVTGVVFESPQYARKFRLRIPPTKKRVLPVNAISFDTRCNRIKESSLDACSLATGTRKKSNSVQVVKVHSRRITRLR
jgi:hypothetical protein